MKNRKIIITAAVLLLAGGYYWYQKSHLKVAPVSYVTADVEKGMLITSVTGSGNVIVDQSSNIDPTITGTVTNLAVNVGDSVKKGQVLFNIVNDQLGVSVAKSAASYQQALSSLASAKAQKTQAQADLESAKKDNAGTSVKEEQASAKKVEAAKLSVEASEKSLVSSLADLKNQQADAAKRIVIAPIDGTVNAVNIKNGDDLSKLSSGSSRQIPIIIGDLGTLKAQVQVNEVDISNVSVGQKVTLTFSAIDGLSATGKVEKVDSLGTLSSGVVTFNVTIGFDALDPRIKSEMSVSAAIITNVKQDVLLIPNGAIKTQNGNSYVEILNSGQTPTRTNVMIGSSNNVSTEILSGVNVGDKVVTQTINSDSATSTVGTASSSNRNSGVRIPGLGGGDH